ncbi:hypothetical protein ACQJBY_000779 [Aegilops geniculata]
MDFGPGSHTYVLFSAGCVPDLGWPEDEDDGLPCPPNIQIWDDMIQKPKFLRPIQISPPSQMFTPRTPPPATTRPRLMATNFRFVAIKIISLVPHRPCSFSSRSPSPSPSNPAHRRLPPPPPWPLTAGSLLHGLEPSPL